MFFFTGSPAVVSDAGREDAGWLRPARFALLLAALVFAAFPQVILGLQTLVYRDFGFFGYPLAHYWRESFWRGELPLWNPLSNCGLPFLAQWNTQVLYPPALFYLLFPLSWSLGVFCLAHLYLGGLGMYFLAHRWTGNRLAAGIAGIVFAFNGLMLNCLMWPNNIAALGWMPWVVWLVERAWRGGGRAALTAAVVGALQMLTGAPEVILLTWGVLAAMAVGDLIFGVQPGRKLLWRFAIIILLITGLAAAQLLPFLDLLAHSHRDQAVGITDWAMPLSGWGNFLVPLFRCHSSYHGVFVQAGQYWTASYYIGTMTVVLALVAVWRSRQWRVWVLAGAVIFCLIMAWGDQGHLYGWLRRFCSALNLMRYPIKFVVVAVFLLPVLAAFGAAVIANHNTPSSARGGWWAAWWVVVALIGLVIWLAWRFPQPDDNWQATWQNAVWRLAFLTLTGAALWCIGKVDQSQRQRALQIVLLILIWFDLWTHAPLQQTANRGIYETALARTDTKNQLLPVPRSGTSRAMIAPAARAELSYSHILNVGDDYLSRRWALIYNCNLLDNIPKLDGFYSLYLREQMYVFPLLYGGSNSYAPKLMDFLGVSMVTSPTNSFEWEPRTTFLPLVTAGQKPTFADGQITITALAGTNFDPSAEAFLPPTAKSFISVTNTTRAQIVSSNFTAHRIELEIEADAPAMVVVAQSYYHLWQAYVDGRPVRLWQANHAFQALEVPAGRHEVKLVYEDRLFYLGVAVSLVTLTGCVLTWFRQQKQAGA